MSNQKLPKKVTGSLMVTLFLIGCSAPIATSTPTRIPTITPTPDIASIFEQACRGVPFPNAAVFSEGHTPHPIVFIPSSYEQFDWNDRIPEERQPTSVSQVELIACLEERETIIDTCTYIATEGVIQLIQQEYAIHLVAAQTGTEIASFTQYVSPRGCPHFATFEPGESIDKFYVDLTLDHILPKIAPYVEASFLPE